MPNLRLYFPVYAAGFAKLGTTSFTAVHGLQSLGVTTRFNLTQIFEIGQIEIYENVEDLPDIEVTMEKVLDGYPLVYHLATNGATSATLAGRSNIKSIVAVSYFTDTQDSASGTPLQQAIISGVFPSSLNYNFQIQGPFTESVTLVGNNKSWLTSGFTFTGGFTNTDSPPGSGGVQFREDLIFSNQGNSSRLPTEIPGISSSGYNELTLDVFGSHLQSIRVSTNLGRDNMLELGRRGPFHRYINFPVEVRSSFEAYCAKGDGVQALENSTSNISDQRILLVTRCGDRFDLGTKNKLNSVTETGGNAGQNGGNRSYTFEYVNFNSLTVTSPSDPGGL